MATGTAEKQGTLEGVDVNSDLGKVIVDWFNENDKENDAADAKIELSMKIQDQLISEKRESVVAQHPETGKPKRFYIEKGKDKLRVQSVPDKVGRTTK